MKVPSVDIQISKSVFNKKFYPLLEATERYLILFGGA